MASAGIPTASLITTIVAGISLAFVFGLIANRLRLPPLVGYLIAGVVIGPHTPGFVANQSLASELAEIGIILLMFGVGLHFSFKSLLSVGKIVVPGALIQGVLATAMGAALAYTLHWPPAAALVFGLALSTASTVVLLRVLEEHGLLQTNEGQIAVGWLVVEDLAMVLVLVLLPVLADILKTSGLPAADPLIAPLGLGAWGVVIFALLKLAAFIGLMLVIGRRAIPWILNHVVHSGSQELFRLAVVAIALGVAFGASRLFGVSLALGAFFAGMVLNGSEFSHKAADESLPLRDVFAVLFFVSVGMLANPAILLTHPVAVILTVLIILIGKSVVAFVLAILLGQTRRTALTISASLAQIGEFSFILAELGVMLHLLPHDGRDLVIAGAIVSIILNSAVFSQSKWWRPSDKPSISHNDTLSLPQS
ncbi:MAG TPA: cation:proton antiporter [Rhizomicrobium sp.]|jgi:CPA2 family monovalent cation:H+ antiporter-2